MRHVLRSLLVCTVALGAMGNVRADDTPTGDARSRIEAARKEITRFDDRSRRQAWWRVAGAERLVARGRLGEVAAVAAGETPESWKLLFGGDLGMILEKTPDGVRLLELYDSAAGVPLLAPKPLPLFTLTLRHAETNEEVRLVADAGWKQTEVVLPAWEGIQIHWRGQKDDRLGDLCVVARVRPDHRSHALHWGLASPWPTWDPRPPCSFPWPPAR